MPPRHRKPAETASAPAEKPAAPQSPAGQVYTHEQRIHAPLDSTHIPGEPTAAVMAAINAGWRPTGEAKVDCTEDVGDGRTLVVWSIPVEAA